MLLAEVGIKTSLLEERFSSKRSIEYVRYNKYLIHEYVQRHLNIRDKVERLLSLLEFNVLVLQNTSIDLAYTFFPIRTLVVLHYLTMTFSKLIISDISLQLLSSSLNMRRKFGTK